MSLRTPRRDPKNEIYDAMRIVDCFADLKNDVVIRMMGRKFWCAPLSALVSGPFIDEPFVPIDKECMSRPLPRIQFSEYATADRYSAFAEYGGCDLGGGTNWHSPHFIIAGEVNRPDLPRFGEVLSLHREVPVYALNNLYVHQLGTWAETELLNDLPLLVNFGDDIPHAREVDENSLLRTCHRYTGNPRGLCCITVTDVSHNIVQDLVIPGQDVILHMSQDDKLILSATICIANIQY